jgi:hypothetical protein
MSTESYIQRIKKYIQSKFYKISEINKRYSTPRVTMTPLVRFSLLFLRLYLLFLVAILFYKFVILLIERR